MIISYTWLKDYLGDKLPPAERVAELLTFHAFEIESVEPVGEDVAIDVKILPDRGSDCLSHRGIARELATLLDVPLVRDPLREAPELRPTEAISVSIEDPEMCPRFTASLMTGIEVKESPQWLKDRLATLGQRSINNIVDATNYVMYAIGQPLHAYDATKFPQIDGEWRFGVRAAVAGETVSLLAEGGKNEERTVTLKGGELLIVDESSGTPIGLAGVKGGRFAGVDQSTTAIIIEAAHFHPTRTRVTARGLGIVIDASKRFENEPSRELPPYAQRDIVALIQEIAGGTYEGTVDVYLKKRQTPTVHLLPAKVNALLGLSLSTTEMISILKRVGVTVEEVGEQLSCTGPWERTDLKIEEDLIEEIGRVYGYQHVQSVVPVPAVLSEYNKRHYYSEVVRTTLQALGFSEVVTSSFRKKDQLELQNALASDKRCLRSSLVKNLEEVLDKNIHLTDLLGISDVRVFEIGTVFGKSAEGVNEHVSLALGVRLRPTGYSGKEDAVLNEAITAVCDALGLQTSSITITSVKGVAEINFSELLAQLPAVDHYEPVVPGDTITYQPFSPYPAVSRDIAMWVGDGVGEEEVAAALRAAAGALLVRLSHVDTFIKDGRTSQAFRLVFQSNEKTLEGSEVDAFMNAIYAAAKERGWEVR